MMEHFVEFTAHPFGDDLHFMVNKLFSRLHGVISKENLNLGLAFPGMSSRSPGKTVRIFGSPRDLEATLKNAGIQHLIDRGFFEISEVKPVPQNAQPVVYLRIRQPEKITATSINRKIKRLKRRAMTRGEKWDQTIHERILKKMKNKQNHISETPYLLIERNGKVFPIFFKKIPLMDEKPNSNPKFNRYGFGNHSNSSLNAVYDF